MELSTSQWLGLAMLVVGILIVGVVEYTNVRPIRTIIKYDPMSIGEQLAHDKQQLKFAMTDSDTFFNTDAYAETRKELLLRYAD